MRRAMPFETNKAETMLAKIIYIFLVFGAFLSVLPNGYADRKEIVTESGHPTGYYVEDDAPNIPRQITFGGEVTPQMPESLRHLPYPRTDNDQARAIDKQTQAINEQSEALQKETKAIERAQWGQEEVAEQVRGLREDLEDQRSREHTEQMVKQHEAEQDRKAKLADAYLDGDESPEVLAEHERVIEGDRQRMVERYELPPDTPYEFTRKIALQALYERSGKITDDEYKVRVKKMVNDYKKSRGVAQSDKNYEMIDMLKTGLIGKQWNLAHGYYTRAEFTDYKKKWLGECMEAEHIPAGEEQYWKQWLDDYTKTWVSKN